MSDSTIVVKEASTWGTAVTPDRTFCLLGSGESLDYTPEIIKSGAHCWNKRGAAAAGEIVIRKAGGGNIPLEVSTGFADIGTRWRVTSTWSPPPRRTAGAGSPDALQPQPFGASGHPRFGVTPNRSRGC